MGEMAEDLVHEVTTSLAKPAPGIPLWWAVTGWVLVILFALRGRR